MKLRPVLACVVFSVASQALAQTQAAAEPQGEPEVVTHEAPATFSSRVNLVSVPVVIRDKDGHSIGGFKQDDFQLSDKGKPQVITKFTVQTSAPVTAAPAAAPQAAPQAADKAAETPEAPSKPTLPDRYVAYFFDDVHMQKEDLLQARLTANRHLDKALDPNTRGGVFTTSGRTTQGFTNDVAKLHDAVNRIQPWSPIYDKSECLQISYYLADILINKGLIHIDGIDPKSLLAQEVLMEATNCMSNPNDSSLPVRYLWQTASTALSYGAEESRSGLRVFEDLIGKMSTLPGSRTIVLVSPGFILTGEQRLDESQVLEDAIRSGVVVNSLDIRGVYTPLRSRTFSAEYGGNFGGPPNGAAAMLYQERERVDHDEVQEAGDVLHELADGTGGTVHDDNDFEGGLKQLAARPDYVYVLGFSPDNLKFDGSYHGLKVKLKQTGYEIEARRGYWAPAHAVDASESAREELKETFFSRDEISEIPLDVHAEFFKPADAKPQVSVVARLDAKGLKFRKAEERNDDTVVVVTGLFDQNGNYVSGIERKIDLRLRDRSLQTLENSGITVEENFSVSPGNYIVRVVVKDSEGRLTAARNTGIEIP